MNLYLIYFINGSLNKFINGNWEKNNTTLVRLSFWAGKINIIGIAM